MESTSTSGTPLHLARQSTQPLYRQIKDHIRGRIESSDWQPGTRLPSENEMVESLSVSRMTIHRALRELSQEGLLERVHGLGTFVAKPTRHASLITLRDIAEEISTAGSVHSCRSIRLKTINATATQARQMELATGTPLFHLRAVHFQDDEPIQLEDRLVNPALAPEFGQQDFNQRTATDYLINLIKPDEMEHIVKAVLPDRATARALKLKPVEPCLQLCRRTWKQNQVVTSVSLTYPGDRYDLAARYKTDSTITR